LNNKKEMFSAKAPVSNRSRSARDSNPSISGVFPVVLSFFRFCLRILIVILSAAAGNFVGDKLRTQITKSPGHQLEFVRTDEYGNTFIAANLLLSNFLPGLLVALIARPRWAFAFLGGLTASFILGDRYEDRLWEALDELLTGGDPTRNWPQPTNPQPTTRPHP
jgi:hypothetical protein